MEANVKQVLASLVNAVLETVKESGGRAPVSAIYLALQEQGMTSSQCDTLINGMVGARLLERKNHELIEVVS